MATFGTWNLSHISISEALLDNLAMADVWFTSDFHIGHFNIIRYCNRPFADTREMNAAILERVNASVKPDDVLYFLGDFCMGGPKAVAFYRDQLACKTIHFIDGNHDRTARKVQHVFTSWSSLSEIKVGKQGIVLCHDAMKVWPHHSRGTWQLLTPSAQYPPLGSNSPAAITIQWHAVLLSCFYARAGKNLQRS